MRESILVQTIQAMQEHINQLNFDNIDEIEQGQRTYFQLLRALQQVPVPLTEPAVILNPTLSTKVTEDVADSSSPAAPQGDVVLYETAVERKQYRFERKLKGGFLPELNAFVPEYKVRDLGLSHGDMVYADFIPGTEELPRYSYDLAQATGKPQKDRLFFPYCIVERDPFFNTLVVSKTANGQNIRVDEAPQTLTLLEADVKELRLKEGDIVDVAYFTSNPNYRKVVWKYDTFELEDEFSRLGSPKPKVEKRSKKEYEQMFTGKTVLMLGLEPEQAEFAREVENRGGSFLFLNGRESRETMTANLSKTDVAIFMLGHVSHNATIWSSQFCKDHGIPFTGLHTFGKSLFIRTAQELLGEQAPATP